MLVILSLRGCVLSVVASSTKWEGSPKAIPRLYEEIASSKAGSDSLILRIAVGQRSAILNSSSFSQFITIKNRGSIFPTQRDQGHDCERCEANQRFFRRGGLASVFQRVA